jgi:hypothetical protein
MATVKPPTPSEFAAVGKQLGMTRPLRRSG